MARRVVWPLAASLVVVSCATAHRPATPAPAASATTATTAVAGTGTLPRPTTTARPPAAVAPAPAEPAAAACAAVPARVAPRPDRPSYRIELAVEPAQNLVEGHLSVTFTPDLPVDRLVFRLWANGPVLAAGGAHLDIGKVSIAGGPAASQLEPDPTTVVVGLGTTVPSGGTVEADTAWKLTLPGTTNDRISRTGDAIRLGSFFPILAWEPGVGWATEPPTAVHGETATSPAADFDVSVAVPPGYAVLASGSPQPDGHRWKADAVPDFGLSVGHFAVVTGTAYAPQPVAVTVGVAAGLADSPAAYLDKTVRALADFGRRFGPYAWASYSLAVTPGLVGGIEYPMHVMQGPGSLGRTTSHELGHQWFYALVGDDQARDPFLDESLASWAESRFEGTTAQMQARTIPAVARGRVGAPMTFWDRAPSAYYLGVYVQGVQALAALGPPDEIDCALRHYVADHAFRIARPADLIADLAAAFPQAPVVLGGYGI